MKKFVDRLAKQFEAKEFAHSYMESHAVSRIAAQIHALRKQRGWSQQKLAAKAGIAQERVSKIESADFDSLTLKTLQKFADAFDVNVSIAFGRFSDGIMDVTNLHARHLEVPSRSDDLAEFCQRRVVQGGDGRWKAMNANHLCAVKTQGLSSVKTQEAGIQVSVAKVSAKPDWKALPTWNDMIRAEGASSSFGNDYCFVYPTRVMDETFFVVRGTTDGKEVPKLPFAKLA